MPVNFKISIPYRGESPAASDAPVFTNTAPAVAHEGELYSHTPTYTGNSPTLSATTLPSWLTLNAGTISGTPSDGDVGNNTLVLELDDGVNDPVEQTVVIFVEDNVPPVFDNTAPSTASEGVAYSHTVQFTDDNGNDTVTVTCPTLPAWLSFNSETLVISGTPDYEDAGDHDLTIRLDDGLNSVVEQDVTITVGENVAPSFTNTIPDEAVSGQFFTHTPTYVDPDNTPVLTANTLPAWATLVDGVLSGTPTSTGNDTIELALNDGVNPEVTQNVSVSVIAPTGGPDLTVDLYPGFIALKIQDDLDNDDSWRGMDIDYSVDGGAFSTLVQYHKGDMYVFETGTSTSTYRFRARHRYVTQTISSIIFDNPSTASEWGVQSPVYTNIPYDESTLQVWASPTGLPTGAGTSGDPYDVWTAVNEAKSRLQAGNHVVLRLASGIYRPNDTHAPLQSDVDTDGWDPIIDMTVTPTNGAKCLIKFEAGADVRGSVDYSAALQTGAVWEDVSVALGESAGTIWKKDWVYNFGYRGSFSSATGIVLARDQVFHDGVRLTHYKADGSAAHEVTGHGLDDCVGDPDSFFVDEDAGEVYLHLSSGNPNTDLIEVGACKTIFKFQFVDGLIINDINMKHCIDWDDAEAAVFASNSNNVIVYDGSVSYSNFFGVKMVGSGGNSPTNFKDYFYLHSVSTSDNGGNGAGAYRIKGYYKYECESNRNGWRGLLGNFDDWSVVNKTNECHKVFESKGYYNNNYGSGLWLDLDCEDVFIWDTQIADNYEMALYLENNQGPIHMYRCSLLNNGKAADQTYEEETIRNSTVDIIARGCLFENVTADRWLWYFEGPTSRVFRQGQNDQSRYHYKGEIVSITGNQVVVSGSHVSLFNTPQSTIRSKVTMETSTSVNGDGVFHFDQLVSAVPSGDDTLLTLLDPDGRLPQFSGGESVWFSLDLVPLRFNMKQCVVVGYDKVVRQGSGSYWTGANFGADLDYNIYHNLGDSPFLNPSASHIDFDAWQSFGYDLNSKVIDPGDYEGYDNDFESAGDNWLDQIEANLSPTVPYAVTNLVAVGKGQEIELSWDVLPQINADSLKVYANPIGFANPPTTLVATIAADLTSYTIPNLNNGTEYAIRLGTNQGVQEEFSSVVTATPIPLIAAVGDTTGDSGNATSASPFIYAHDHLEGNLVLVAVASDVGASDSYVTSVTYGGTPMVKAANEGFFNFNIGTSIWYLKDPPNGLQNVQVNVSNDTWVVAIAQDISNVGADLVDDAAGRGEEIDSNTRIEVTVDPTVTATAVFVAHAELLSGSASPVTPSDSDIAPDPGLTELEEVRMNPGSGYAGALSLSWKQLSLADAAVVGGNSSNTQRKAIHAVVFSRVTTEDLTFSFTISVNDSQVNEGEDVVLTPSTIIASDGTSEPTRVDYYVYSTLTGNLETFLGSATDVTNFELTIDSFPPDLYYGVVGVAVKDTTESVSSNMVDFEVIADALLISPADAATGLGTNPTFIWIPDQATKYHFQLSTASDFGTTVVDDNTLTDNIYQAAGLSGGTTYYWRVRVSDDDGVNFGNWTTARSFIPSDAVAPSFSVAPASANIGENGFDITATPDEDATLFVVALADGASTPTGAAIEAGTGALASGSSAVTDSVQGSVTLSGLASSTAFDVFAVLKDASGNYSTVGSVADVTTLADSTPPVFSTAPATQTIQDTQISFTFTSNENGTVYAVAIPDGDAAPSGAQIEAGTDGDDSAAVDESNVVVTADAANSLILSTLVAFVEYDCYFVIKDGAGNYSSVVKVDAQTSDADAPIFLVAPDPTTTTTSITITATANETCTMYVVVLPHDTENVTPSASQVIQGRDADDNIVTSGNQSMSASVQGAAVISALSTGVGYDVYVCLQDTATNTTGVTKLTNVVTSATYVPRWAHFDQYNGLEIPYSTDVNLSQASWMVSFWANIETLPGSYKRFISLGYDHATTAAGYVGLRVRMKPSNDIVAFYGSGGAFHTIGDFAASADTSYLLSVAKYGGFIYFYVNGSLIGTSSDSLEPAGDNGEFWFGNSAALNSGVMAYLRNLVYVSDYSAQADIVSDLGDIYAAGQSANLSGVITGLRGTVQLAVPCDEYSAGTSAVQRDDISGNSRHLTDTNTVPSENDSSLGGDAVAPTFDAGPTEGTTTGSTTQVTATLDENGTLYGVVVPDGAGAPSASQIKLGNNASDLAAVASDSSSMTGSVSNSVDFTGLDDGVAYDVYVYAEDTSGNGTSVIKVDVTTVDTTPPSYDESPSVSSNTGTAINISSAITESGYIYGVVLADGASAPSAAQIEAGTDSTDTPVASGFDDSQQLNALSADTLEFSNLTSDTAYDVWLVTKDTAGNYSTPSKLDVTTADITPPTFSSGPTAASVGGTSLNINATLNESGDMWVVIVADGATAPSVAQVKLGNDSTDSAALASDSDLGAGTSKTTSLSGLTSETAYDAYVVASDESGNDQASVTKVDFTTADVTGPSFSVAAAAENVSDDTFDITATLDENGTFYGVALPDGSSTPTGAQIEAGSNASDQAVLADMQDSSAMTASVEVTLNFGGSGGLDPETAYDVFVVGKDSSGNYSTVVKVDVTTTAAADTTPPTFSAGPSVANNTSGSAFDIEATLNENGKLYVLVMTDGAGAPSAAEVKAGSATGSLVAGSDVASETVKSVTISSVITSETDYDVYVAAEDDTGNLQASPTLVEVTTPDVTGPSANEAPASSNITGTGFDITGEYDEDCTFYGVVVADGAGAPSGAQIAAGNDSTDSAALDADQQAMTQNVGGQMEFTGLSSETAYDCYVVARDSSGNYSSVVKVDVTTADVTAPTFSVAPAVANNTSGTAFDITATTNENADLYVLVLPEGGAVPTAAEVKAGSSTGSIVAGSDIAAETVKSVTISSSITSETNYDVYVVAEDASGNLQATATVVEVTTPDVTGPGYDEAPASGNVTGTGFDITATFDEDCTFYGVVVADGATAPSAAQIEAGNDSTDSSALDSDSQAMTALSGGQMEFTGLSSETAYDCYVVGKDSAGNYSTVVKVDVTTADVTPPTFSVAAAAASVTASGLTATATLNENGDMWAVVVADGATAPSVAQVKAGNDSTDSSALASGSDLASSTAKSIALTGLSASTAYDLYVVASDESSNDQAAVTKVDFTTSAAAGYVMTRGAVGGNGQLELSMSSNFYIASNHAWVGFKMKTGTLTGGSAQSLIDVAYGSNDNWKLEINTSKQLQITYGDGDDPYSFTGSTTLANDTEYTIVVDKSGGTWSILVDDVAESLSGDTGETLSNNAGGTIVVLGAASEVAWMNNLIWANGYSSSNGLDTENYYAWPAWASVEFFELQGTGGTEQFKVPMNESSTTGASTQRTDYSGNANHFTDAQYNSNYVASVDMEWDESRWAVGDNGEDPRLEARSVATTAATNFSTGNPMAVAFLFRPYALDNTNNQVICSYGFDASSNEGFNVEIRADERIRLFIPNSGGDVSVQSGTSVIADDTEYWCAIYQDGSNVYLRLFPLGGSVNEVGNTSTAISASTQRAGLGFLNEVDNTSKGIDSYAKNVIFLSGGYSGTPATALTEIRADLAAIEAITPDENFKEEVEGLSLTGTVQILAPMDEAAVTTRRNIRPDYAGQTNSYFEDRYASYPPSSTAWVASVDDDTL